MTRAIQLTRRPVLRPWFVIRKSKKVAAHDMRKAEAGHEDCRVNQKNFECYNDSVSKFITLATICLLVTLLAQTGSCRSSNANTDMTSPQSKSLPTGVWGGEHINAEVTESGVEIEFDCAHGSIPTRVVIDARGRFNVRGKFTAEHGGAFRRDE